MSQNDMSIANAVGATVRADINSALQALASSSKGATAPSTPYAGQLWIEDDNPSASNWTLWFYDGTDWISIGTIDTTGNTFSATNGVKTNVAPSFTVAINEAAAVDVASATTTDIGAAASNNVRVTGTTTITGLGTAAAGITRRVRFAGALTLTHNATSLILPTAANITTAADDTAEFLSLGSGNWFCYRYNRKSGAALAGASNLVQRAYASLATVQTGTTMIPADDTIPQNTEGTEFLTLAITPTSATNRLRIRVSFNVAIDTSNFRIVMALFQDTTANALCAVACTGNSTANRPDVLTMDYEMVAGTTSSTTFKIRIGPTASATVTINGALGSRLFGGVAVSNITIDEIVP